MCHLYLLASILIEVNKCPLLTDPINGKVLVSDDGKNATITCKSGFRIPKWRSSLKCVNGTWSALPPKKCVN